MSIFILTRHVARWSLRGLATIAIPAVALAQSGDDQATKLAKASQNPIADLVSIPFQYNSYSGGGLSGQALSNLNVQPVLPLPIGKRWNLIARTIIPFFNVPMTNGSRAKGVGDIQQQFFFSQTKPTSLVWGVGPLFSVPTATDPALVTGAWALGPTAVVVKLTGPWVLGTLVSQIWTIAHNGHDATDVNQFSLQPFINYNLPDGWALAFAPIITSDWKAAPGAEEWTVPLGIGVSKVTAIGKQPMSLGIQYYDNVVRPASAGHNQVKFFASLLFPKAAEK